MRQDTPPDPARLLDEAIDLIIRLQNDPTNPVAAKLARSWRARSEAHELIWQQVAAAHGATGQVLKAKRQPGVFSRRRLLTAGFIGAGGYAVGAIALPDFLLHAKADYITEKKQILSITLPEGSIAVLGPESALAVHFSPTGRRIDLIKGLSFFDVTSDVGRPFIVSSGAMKTTADQTSFDVSQEGESSIVSVQDGNLSIKIDDAKDQSQIDLAEGDWLRFNVSDHGIDRGKMETDQVGSWRRNKIIADGQSVGSLIDKIGRWHPGRIFVMDPSILDRKVSGLFDLTDTKAALEAVVHPVGAHVRQVASYLTIISSF